MSVTLDTSELDGLLHRLYALADPPLDDLLEQLGADLEAGVRKRLSVTKTDPSGAAWTPWSPGYAARRPNKGGLLDLEGQLIDSIAFELEDGAVAVGSPMVYAMTHQAGRGPIPERAFLGISDEDAANIQATTQAWMSRLLGGLA